MDRPQTRYTKTSDGMSIAYSVFGRGRPLVYSFTLSHQILFLESPVWRPWFEGLADRYQVIVFDSRGCGLSQRNVAWTPEGFERDLEAVVNSLTLNDYFVFSTYAAGHGAIRHAIAHPDRVAGLIFWASFVDGATALERTFLFDLAKQNWEFFLQTIPQTMFWLEPREIRTYIDILRQAITQEEWLALMTSAMTSNVESILPELCTPALVLHPRELEVVKVGEAMRLASMLQNGQLVLLEGPRAVPTGDVVEPSLAAIAEFMEGLSGTPDDHPGPVIGGLRIVVFTDIVGHTEMMQRLGDAKGRDVLREHERITRETLKQHGGAEVKTMGDGFMASFGSVTQAMECAVSLQRAFSGRGATMDDGGWTMEEPLSIRIGLNAGEPIEEDGDLFGATVILASRIAAKAAGGEILIPEPVRHLLSGKAFIFSDRGEHAMKGFDDAVRLYEVRWRE